MENTVEVGIALACATMLLSLYFILRRAMNTDSSPAWLRSEVVAYTCAVPFTILIGASFAYLAIALNAFVNVWIAGLIALAVHGALIAAFMWLLPATQKAAETTSSAGQAINQPSAAAA